MGTDYRSTGKLRFSNSNDVSEFEFDDSLQAQIGQPTKASQYNALEENANFLFFSAMHGRRGHTPECIERNMNECESGRVWVFGKFVELTAELQTVTIHNPVRPGNEDVTIPFDWTGRILTVHLVYKLVSGESDEYIDSLLPGGSRDDTWASGWQSPTEHYTVSRVFYTGSGGENYRWKIEDRPDYNPVRFYLFVDSSDSNKLKFGFKSAEDPAGRIYKCAFILDISYSPRIPYYGED